MSLQKYSFFTFDVLGFLLNNGVYRSFIKLGYQMVAGGEFRNVSHRFAVLHRDAVAAFKDILRTEKMQFFVDIVAFAGTFPQTCLDVFGQTFGGEFQTLLLAAHVELHLFSDVLHETF